MQLERRLAEFVTDIQFRALPPEPIDIEKKVILTVIGTTIAGATQEGCEPLVKQVREWGGREEATILIHGGKVPAYNAGLVNSVMARALDIDDAMTPGIHVGSAAVPTALATAELTGGCSGKEFLAALVLGTELAARLNSSSVYDGFDPTGICTIFATAAIAGRILHLDSSQMLNALALAFNKSGGSFQSNIDGSLAVRTIQGFVSQGGIICAQLAERGITGPVNFLEGIYGYFHLYSKDRYNPQVVVAELGERFDVNQTVFKYHPSCGGTLASTDAILNLVREKKLTPEEVDQIDIKVTSEIYKLVGHEFEIGNNPTVNAQFSIQYCVASALLRKGSTLHYFEESYVLEPKVMELIKKIRVSPEPTFDKLGPSGRYKVEMTVTTTSGDTHRQIVDVPHGIPPDSLTNEELMERFRDAVSYASKPLPANNIERIVSEVNQLEKVEDVRVLVPLLLS